MPINLVKGQRVEIGLQKLGVGLGWDPNSGASNFGYDLDASAFLLGAGNQIPNERFFVFYGNQESMDGAVKSSGDDQTGGNSDGDDETLEVDLERLDPRIDQIVFTVSIYDAEARRQNFGQVRNSFIRIYDAVTNAELCKYELDEDFSVETALEFGRLYKRNGAWKFEALGISANGGLQGLVRKYAGTFAS
jgi:tellurium resistance protein TerD